jgi:hypothetical protein
MTRRTSPLLLLAGALTLPLLLGLVTVTYRDVSATHLAAKVSLARQLAEGNVPYLFPEASLGQPLLGDPNYQPFLPDSLLFLVLPPWHAAACHFAFTFLIAIWSARRWARTLGARRREADLVGALFAFCGPVISAWTFWNGTTLALAPALLAAAEKVGRRVEERDRRRALSAAVELGLFAALLVACGEPVPLVLAVLFGAARLGRRVVRNPGGFALPAAAALVVGGLVAAPQIVSTLQILPSSSRGLARFSFRAANAQSVDPARAAELLAPYPHGRPDRLPEEGGFDRHEAFDGHAPYLWSLHPGWVLASLLLCHPGAFRREKVAAALLVAAAVLSLGRALPFAEALHPLLSLGGRVRYPVKWWYLAALALVPLAVESLRQRRSSAGSFPAARWIVAAGGAAALALSLHGGAGAAMLLLPSIALALLATLPRFVVSPAAAAAAGALAHAPLLLAVIDRPPPSPPPLPGRVYERVAFEPQGNTPPGVPRQASPAVWRRLFSERWALSGAVSGIPYAFDGDPDGSYSWYDRIVRESLAGRDWAGRATPLRLAGVRTVLAREQLPPPYERTGEIGDGGVAAWNLPGSAPAVRIATRIHGSPSFNETFAIESRAEFDPRRDTVLPAKRSFRALAPPRSLEVLEETGSRLVVEVDGDGGTLVWQRTYWPAFRASGGLRIRPADGHLVGVELPPGRRRLTIEWNPRPLRFATLACLAGLVGAALFLISVRKSEGLDAAE